MQSLLESFTILLITPPGNLAYYLVLTFSVAGALQGALTTLPSDPAPRRRMLAGLILLLLVQVGLFIAAGFAWQGALPSAAGLPIVDRAAALLSAVLFIWLWNYSQSRRSMHAALILITLSVVVGLVMAGLWWNVQSPEMPFNSSLADIGLNGLAIAVLTFGILALLLHRPQNWGIGLAMLLLLASGHALSLTIGTPSGDYSGILRLFQLAAFPWLLALPRSLENLANELPKVQTAPVLPPPPVVPERKRYNLQPNLVQELLQVVREPEHPDFGRSLVKVVAQIMLADYCMLLIPSDENGQIMIAQVYNLIEEKNLEGFSIDSQLLPGIDDALRRNRILRLPSGSASTDLAALAHRMRMNRVGHLMVVPITPPGRESSMALMVLSPFSNRSWAADDQTFLGQIAAAITISPAAKLVNLARSTETQETTQQIGDVERFVHQLQMENQRLQADLEQMRYQIAEERSRAEALAELVETQRQGDENKSTAAYQDDGEHLENELHLALRQIADLEQILAESDRKLLEAQSPRRTTAPIRQQDRDEITNLVEELRQPLASVIGNAEMLLGESMGILGAFQKKFVERIRTSGERMTVLFDDLVQTVNLASAGEVMVPQPIDLNAIIDNAIEVAMVPLRGKNLTLRVDIPADLPTFRADPQSLQRILTNLLQNAGTCTPPEGEVSLRARAELPDHEPGYILIQVSDSGGGIEPDDLPHIFSQNLIADLAPISGLGTPPDPFGTTKALVEAHGGRIWVDSVVGQGATFSALFPIASEGLSVR